MTNKQTYKVGTSRLTVEFGDLTGSQACVLVSSDDYYLSMGGGVSKSILEAGGETIAHDAAKMVPAALGDVVVTTAGKLPARYIFHVVTLGPRSKIIAPVRIIEQATARCMELLDSFRLSSIAFPAIGAGTARFRLEHVAAEMAKAISQKLRSRSSPVEVSIYLFDQFQEKDYRPFFQEFTRRTPELPAVDIIAAPDRPAGDTRAQSLRRQVFYSYSHKDERWRQQLEVQLAMLRREGLIEDWHDRQIGAGEEWKQAIDENLERADIVLLLVSPEFLASDYCYDVEMTRALARHDAGTARVIPIILHDVDFQFAPFKKLQVLPKDGKAVDRWTNRYSAWKDVTQGIRKVVKGE